MKKNSIMEHLLCPDVTRSNKSDFILDLLLFNFNLYCFVYKLINKGVCLQRKVHMMTGLQPPCLRVKLIYLCSAKRKPWPNPPVNGCRKGEINSPLPETGWNQEIVPATYSLFTLPPHLPISLFYKKKKKLALRPQEGDFLGISLPSCLTPGFLNVIIPCPNTSSPNLLVYHVANRMSLDSTTQILN